MAGASTDFTRVFRFAACSVSERSRDSRDHDSLAALGSRSSVAHSSHAEASFIDASGSSFNFIRDNWSRGVKDVQKFVRSLQFAGRRATVEFADASYPKYCLLLDRGYGSSGWLAHSSDLPNCSGVAGLARYRGCIFSCGWPGVLETCHEIRLECAQRPELVPGSVPLRRHSTL